MSNKSPDERSGIYVRYNPYYDSYYVGQTRNLGYRYQDDKTSGYAEQTVAFQEVPTDSLDLAEQLAIDFCRDFFPQGITNIRGNQKRW